MFQVVSDARPALPQLVFLFGVTRIKDTASTTTPSLTCQGNLNYGSGEKAPAPNWRRGKTREKRRRRRGMRRKDPILMLRRMLVLMFTTQGKLPKRYHGVLLPEMILKILVVQLEFVCTEGVRRNPYPRKRRRRRQTEKNI